MDEKLTLEQLFEDARLYINIYEKGKDDIDGVITESDLKSFFRCPYSYFLKKKVGMSKIPRSAFSTLALMFQQARKGLYNLRDPDTGRIFPFQHRDIQTCNLAEEMDSETLQKSLAISTPKKFGNALKGKWQYFISNGKYAGTEIAWAYDNQPGVASNHIAKAARNYYNFVLEHGAPVLGFINTTETFEFEGNRFNIKIPEIRRGMHIDDPTMWGFNTDEMFDKVKSDIRTSSLVTLRVLGFCTLAHDIELYRMKWGVPDQLAERWDGKESHLSPEAVYRHFNALKAELSTARREEEDLDTLRRAVEHFQEEVEKERFRPVHSSCASCQYNVLDPEGDVVCRKAKKGVKPAVPLQYFKKELYEIQHQETEEGFKLTGKVRKHADVAKEVNSMEFSTGLDGNMLIAESRYTSRAHGLGLEDLMLKEADHKLQELADALGRTVVHRVNFYRDFDFAGKKGVKHTLYLLRYEDLQKEYMPQD